MVYTVRKEDRQREPDLPSPARVQSGMSRFGKSRPRGSLWRFAPGKEHRL